MIRKNNYEIAITYIKIAKTNLLHFYLGIMAQLYMKKKSHFTIPVMF